MADESGWLCTTHKRIVLKEGLHKCHDRVCHTHCDQKQLTGEKNVKKNDVSLVRTGAPEGTRFQVWRVRPLRHHAGA